MSDGQNREIPSSKHVVITPEPGDTTMPEAERIDRPPYLKGEPDPLNPNDFHPLTPQIPAKDSKN